MRQKYLPQRLRPILAPVAGSEESTAGTYQVEELPADVAGLEAALLRWNQVYETVRPHQALGYQTPHQFYQDWLTIHPAREEVLSDMS